MCLHMPRVYFHLYLCPQTPGEVNAKREASWRQAVGSWGDRALSTSGYPCLATSRGLFSFIFGASQHLIFCLLYPGRCRRKEGKRSVCSFCIPRAKCIVDANVLTHSFNMCLMRAHYMSGVGVLWALCIPWWIGQSSWSLGICH